MEAQQHGRDRSPRLESLPHTSAWFAGPKAEHGEWFSGVIRAIAQDYYSWRRNYFPEDGVVVDSQLRHNGSAFQDAFNDRLFELLARLKGDFPFYSPRYAAHMLAEQSLPSIAGYFAAMLYNPNNVSNDSAPVTVRLELEACAMISRMLGHGQNSWSHLTSGGTLANFEALWMARTTCLLPFVVRDMRAQLGLSQTGVAASEFLHQSPTMSLNEFAKVFDDAYGVYGPDQLTIAKVIHAYLDSPHNVVEQGVSVYAQIGSQPVLLVPETHHYCFEKALDVLGLGRRALRSVRVDSDFRMRVEDLERQLDSVRKEGNHVLAVVAVIGTTEEGAVDPLDEILNLRRMRETSGKGSFWLHADAAYGGYLRTMTIPSRLGLGEATTEVKLQGQTRNITLDLPEHSVCGALECLGECDSIAIDPHKLGYIPYPAGAISFKSNLVKPLARQDAPYLTGAPQDVKSERLTQSIGMYVLEGSKPGAAAASVWLSHSLIPLDNTGHGMLIRDTVRNACELHSLLEHYDEIAGPQAARAVCLCPPGSNIVCYAFRPATGIANLSQLNALNAAIYRRFTLREGERVYDQSFFVSRTTLSKSRYSADTVRPFLSRLGTSESDFMASDGVFLLRSTLMNPWYGHSKKRGRYFLSELATDLYSVAADELSKQT
ncbi:MAG: pyridoxal-dependent decarboxylase [Phycisphaerales bacterium]